MRCGLPARDSERSWRVSMANELAALSQELAAAVQKVSPFVVAVDARPRFASSGVLWRPGIVVTAEHTVRREEEITVTLPDGSNVPATLAGADPGTDLAGVARGTPRAAPRPTPHGARPRRFRGISRSPSAAPGIPASTQPGGSSALSAVRGAPGGVGAWTITSGST